MFHKHISFSNFTLKHMLIYFYSLKVLRGLNKDVSMTYCSMLIYGCLPKIIPNSTCCITLKGGDYR